MSTHLHSPRPMIGLNTSGIFSHEEPVLKSVEMTPMERQRAMDGTPMTVGAHSRLRPQGRPIIMKGAPTAPTDDEIRLRKGRDMQDRLVKAREAVAAFLAE